MKRRSPTEWQTIIQEQEASGLPIVTYCQQHGINYRTFIGRKAKFAKTPTPPSTALIAVGNVRQQQAIVLEVGKSKLRLPANIDAGWLAQLVSGISQ